MPVARGLPASPSARPARQPRFLFERLLSDFHQACDVEDLDVAEALLGVLEMMLARPPRPEDGGRRRRLERLVAAHERLWHLRHPSGE